MIPVPPVQCDIIWDIFGNILVDLIFIVFLLVGVITGILFRPKARNQVRKFDVHTKRFIDYDIEEESARSVYCEPQKNQLPQLFFKIHPGFTGIVGRFIKRPITTYIGRAGTAFTWKMQSAKVDVGTLAETLKTLWGDAFYSVIPAEKRLELEESKINVTVGMEEYSPPAGITDPQLTSLSEEDIYDEQDRQAAKTWWEGVKAGEHKDLVLLILAVAAGFGLAFVTLVVLGKLK